MLVCSGGGGGILGLVDTFLTSGVPTSDQILENAAGSTLGFNSKLAESHTNESAVLSVLMNFNTDAQITFLKILKAHGNKKEKRKKRFTLLVWRNTHCFL